MLCIPVLSAHLGNFKHIDSETPLTLLVAISAEHVLAV